MVPGAASISNPTPAADPRHMAIVDQEPRTRHGGNGHLNPASQCKSEKEKFHWNVEMFTFKFTIKCVYYYIDLKKLQRHENIIAKCFFLNLDTAFVAKHGTKCSINNVK